MKFLEKGNIIINAGFRFNLKEIGGKYMLMIIMHNKRDYLEYLLFIMKRENIIDATIIEKKGIGGALFGDRDSPIMHRGNLFRRI